MLFSAQSELVLLIKRSTISVWAIFIWISPYSAYSQATVNPLPVWFQSPEKGLKGTAVIRSGSILDSLDIERVFDMALQSLNANRRQYFMAEHFDEGLDVLHSFYEYAIEPMFQREQVYISEQVHIDPWFFVELRPLKEVTFSPIESDQWLIEDGTYPLSTTQPYTSFERAKQSAIKKLAYHAKLDIQGTQWASSGFSGDLFFIKSRVLFENVIVTDRRVKNGEAYVKVKILKSNINPY